MSKILLCAALCSTDKQKNKIDLENLPIQIKKNIAMEASNTFENLLLQVKSSNLNFKIELSPFSAFISVKKSFIKDKSGNPHILMSPHADSNLLHLLRKENLDLSQQIREHEIAIKSVTLKYENAVDDSEEAHQVIKKLNYDILKLRSEITNKSVKNEEVSKISDIIRVTSLENELLENNKQLQDIIGQSKNYKIEIKHLNSKQEKLIFDNRHLKSEKENLKIYLLL